MAANTLASSFAESTIGIVLTSQRSHNLIITSFLRQNDVATSFWRKDDVIITSCSYRDVINVYLCAIKKDFHNLCHPNVGESKKMKICFFSANILEFCIHTISAYTPVHVTPLSRSRIWSIYFLAEASHDLNRIVHSCSTAIGFFFNVQWWYLVSMYRF